MHKYENKPWFGLVPHDLSNKHLAELLESIAREADMELYTQTKTGDRKISAVGLADILMAAAERISDV